MPGIDLSTLFQADPAAQELGLGFLGQEKDMNKARLAQQLFETDKQRQMLPLELQGKQLSNQTAQAQIPGLQAQSEKQQLDTRFSRETLGPKIESELSKYKGQMSDSQLKELTNAGQAYMQAGPLLDRMPGVVTHAAAKQILGNFYRPEFDQIPANALGQVISHFGETMVAAQSKYVQQLGLLGAKNEGAKDVAGINANARVEAARIAAAAKIRGYDNEIAQIREKAKLGTYPQRASYYIDKAHQLAEEAAFAEDEQIKKALLERAKMFGQIANEAQQVDLAAKAAAAQEANKGKPDLGGFGIPTVTPPGQAPGAQVPGMAPGVNPTVAPSSGSPAQNRNGRTGKQMDTATYQRWFNAAKAANPNMSDAAIEQEAMKRGYK